MRDRHHVERHLAAGGVDVLRGDIEFDPVAGAGEGELPGLLAGVALVEVQGDAGRAQHGEDHQDEEEAAVPQPAPAHVGLVPGATGCCWVAQWMPPPPEAMWLMDTWETFRPGWRSPMIPAARSSAAWSPKRGTMTPPLQT